MEIIKVKNATVKEARKHLREQKKNSNKKFYTLFFMNEEETNGVRVVHPGCYGFATCGFIDNSDIYTDYSDWAYNSTEKDVLRYLLKFKLIKEN